MNLSLINFRPDSFYNTRRFHPSMHVQSGQLRIVFMAWSHVKDFFSDFLEKYDAL